MYDETDTMLYMEEINKMISLFIMTATLRILSLILVIYCWVARAQYIGRTVRTYMPAPVEPCYGNSGGFGTSGSDDLSALLALARILDSSQNQNTNEKQNQNQQPCGCPKSNDVNTEDIIHKLIDALVYATVHNNGGKNSDGHTVTAVTSTAGSSSSQGVVPGLLGDLVGSSGQTGISGSSYNDGSVTALLKRLLSGGNDGLVTSLLRELLGSSSDNKGVVPDLLGSLVGSAPGGGNGAVTQLLDGGSSDGNSGLVGGLLGGGNGGSKTGLVGGLLGGGSGGSNSGLVDGLLGGGDGGSNSGLVNGLLGGKDGGLLGGGDSSSSSGTTNSAASSVINTAPNGAGGGLLSSVL